MSATVARRPGASIARLAYPALRTASISLGVFIAAVSLASDPSGVTGGGGVIADWVSTVLFGAPAYGDKVAHFAAYAVFSLVTSLAFGRHREPAALVLLFLLVFGGALELMQAAGGVRTGDWLDLLANTLGIMAGGAAGAAARLFARWQGIRLA